MTWCSLYFHLGENLRATLLTRAQDLMYMHADFMHDGNQTVIQKRRLQYYALVPVPYTRRETTRARRCVTLCRLY